MQRSYSVKSSKVSNGPWPNVPRSDFAARALTYAATIGGITPFGGSITIEAQPNVRVPRSLRRNVSRLTALNFCCSSPLARARNSSGEIDSGRLARRGDRRGSSASASTAAACRHAVHVVGAELALQMSGSPHDVRGAFQLGLLNLAMSCSAGIDRSSDGAMPTTTSPGSGRAGTAGWCLCARVLRAGVPPAAVRREPAPIRSRPRRTRPLPARLPERSRSSARCI